MISLNTTGPSFDSIEEYLKTNPKDASAWNLKAVLLANKGNYGEALRCLNQAIRLNPDLAEAHANRGRVLLQLGPDRASDALRSFETALELKPENLEFLSDMANAFRILGRKDEELKYLRDLTQHIPDKPLIWVRIGDIEVHRGNLKSAVKAFDRALDLQPDFKLALMHRAIALSMLEQWKDAIKSAEAATKIDSEDKEVWRTLGEVSLGAEKFKSAAKALKKAAEIDPEDAEVYIGLGMIAYRTGDLKDAVRYLKKALVRDKKNRMALRNLGFVAMDLEDWEEARDAWERLTAIVKKKPEIYDAKAITLARLNDFCAAAESWETARKLYKKANDTPNAERVTDLGRAARINCSKMKKLLREQKEKEKQQRRHGSRPTTRRKRS
ncbi:MAG: tetratricopeptide repeat protein [Candidatus Thorarchaeota archaeon]